MAKKIEVVSASNPQVLKEHLEKMVNDGWEIKGFVCCDTKNSNSESFAVLERFYDEEPSKRQQFIETENPLEEHTPQPPRTDIANLGKS